LGMDRVVKISTTIVTQVTEKFVDISSMNCEYIG